MRLLFALLVGVWTCTAAMALPLLDNGGFEEGDPPAGWQLALSDRVFAIDRAIAVEGKRSLRYSNSLTTQPGPWPVTHSVVAPARRTLTVRGQVRTAGFRGTIEAMFYAPDLFGDAQLVGRTTVVSAEGMSSTADWRPFAFLAAPAAEGGLATLRLSFKGTGRAWIDALEATAAGAGGGGEPGPPRPAPRPVPLPMPIPSGENLLRDTGFEGSESGGPWRRFWNPRRAFGIVCLFDTQQAYRGSRSALITNRSPFSRDPAGWCQDISPVAAGGELVLLGQVRTENVQGSACLRIECWGRRPRPEGATEEAPEELLASATSEAFWLSGTNAWTPVAARLSAPQGTTRAVAACVMAGMGSAWFDEVRLMGIRRQSSRSD